MSIESVPIIKFEDLDINSKVDFIVNERTPSPEQVVYDSTIDFLDPQNKLTREERARVVAMGDRTAISYSQLSKKVIADRELQLSGSGEVTDKTASFFQMYALAARSSNEIAHTSILEQSGVGPDISSGDPPIIMEGISILAGLRDVCSQRHAGFEAFSSRGGIFPEKYWRVPGEMARTKQGKEIESISMELYRVYLDLTKAGIKKYLETENLRPNEKPWQYRWRILNLALDDSRQVTNSSFLNHLSYHPNSALSVRDTIVELSASDLPETMDIAGRLRTLATVGLPNIMKHTEPSEYTKGLKWVRDALKIMLPASNNPMLRGTEGESEFLSASVSPKAERTFLKAFLASRRNVSYDSAERIVNGLSEQKIEDILSKIFRGLTIHDKPPKELEMIQINASFNLSVGAIYELIRHRPMTHIVSDFSINHGFTIPNTYKNFGLEETYKYGISLNERMVDLVADLGARYSVFIPYYASRAHLQPVTIRMNGADAFHFLKIRASDAAHPDIKKPAYGLESFLRNESPVIFGHLVKK